MRNGVVKKHNRQDSSKIKKARTMIMHEDFLQPFMGFHYRMLTEQFQEMVAVNPEATECVGPTDSVIVEWLGLGNLASLVEIEENLEPVEEIPAEIPNMDDENASSDDELIDVEEKVDAIEVGKSSQYIN